MEELINTDQTTFIAASALTLGYAGIRTAEYFLDSAREGYAETQELYQMLESGQITDNEIRADFQSVEDVLDNRSSPVEIAGLLRSSSSRRKAGKYVAYTRMKNNYGVELEE